MNNKHIVFLILAILVIAFLWNKNEHLDSNVDNVIAKGTITTGSAGNQFQLIQSLQDGKNNILSILPLKLDGTPNWDNNIVVGGGGNNNIWTNKNIASTGNINAGGTITGGGNITGGGLISEKDAWIKGVLAVSGQLYATGGFKTPLDMTRVDAKMMNVWNDTGYDDSFCPDGYYMYGVTKATHKKGATFNPACRKLPGA